MNLLVFDESTASALRELNGNRSGSSVLMDQSADPLTAALERESSVLLMPSLQNDSALVIEISRRQKKVDTRPETPRAKEERRMHPRESSGFLGLDGDAVYLDEEDQKPSWWRRLFGN